MDGAGRAWMGLGVRGQGWAWGAKVLLVVERVEYRVEKGQQGLSPPGHGVKGVGRGWAGDNCIEGRGEGRRARVKMNDSCGRQALQT